MNQDPPDTDPNHSDVPEDRWDNVDEQGAGPIKQSETFEEFEQRVKDIQAQSPAPKHEDSDASMKEMESSDDSKYEKIKTLAGDEIKVPKDGKERPISEPIIHKETTLEELDKKDKIPEDKMYAEADMFPEPDVEEIDQLKSEDDSDAELRDIDEGEKEV